MQRLRLIQCGVGGMGRTWWQGPVKNSPDFELVAIADIAEAPLHEAGDALGLPRERRAASLEAALHALQADAVLTVTPPAVHVEHAELAFSRGLHLLTEKPIAHDLASARRMVGLARQAGRQLMIAQNYRYSAPMQRLKSLVEGRVLGEIGHVHIDFYIPADFTGTFRQTMHYPLLVDMSIHHIDLIRAVMGRDIASITATTFNPAWSWYEHHAGLKMLLELEGGIMFSYSGDWSARGRCTSWNGDWRIQCAEGSIHTQNDAITLARCGRWNENPTQETIPTPALERSGQAALLHNFADSIRTGRPAETSGEDNLKSFAAVMGAMISARDRRTVDPRDLLV